MADNTIDRLKSQLLRSNLAIKDQVLFQIINQLIDAVSGNTAAISAGSGSGSGGSGGSTVNNITQQFIVNEESGYERDGCCSICPPGPIGLTGPIGPMGPPGFILSEYLESLYEYDPVIPYPVLNTADIAFKSKENIFTDLFGVDIQRSGTARLALRRTNSGADDKQWYIQLQADELYFTIDTDARDSPTTVAILDRAGLLSVLSNLRIGGLAAGSGLLVNLVNSVHRLTPTTFQIANTGIHNLGLNSQNFHFLFLLAGTTGQMAIFAVHGGLQVTNLVYSSGAFSITAGTGASTNVYWSVGNVRYEIQNNLGSAVDYYAVAIGV